MNMIIHTMTIRGIPHYECAGCKRTAEGSTVRIELSQLHIRPTQASIVVARECAAVSNRHLPVGWVSNGRDDVRCPECGK